jgi:octaprenyl-diphosphate synthase
VTVDQNPSAVAYSAKSAEAPPATRYLSLVADKLVQTDEVFRRNLASDVPFIEMSGEYIFAGGGKRIRPAMLLLCARLLGRDSDEEVTYGAVIELIHNATLIHDDIIDHSSLRRGRKTINQRWGNGLTVLLGDWLYTTSMRMAIDHGNLEIIRILCDSTLRMTEGELLALDRLGQIDLTTDEYFEITQRKTAQLFSAACSIPAVMYPQRLELQEPLARYGRSLGICFQLVDDLLDFTGRQAELGKPVLSDLKEGRLTLPLILLLPRVSAEQRDQIRFVLEDREFRRTEPEQIMELVRSEGTVDEAYELAVEHADAARRALESLPSGDAREALEFAPDFVLNRRS